MDDLRIGYLSDFPIQILAQIADWLDEQGELLVDANEWWYFIRSLHDLRWIMLEGDRSELPYVVYREALPSVRGTADGALLERALQEFPEGVPFYVMTFAYVPSSIDMITQGSSHQILCWAFAEHWGQPIALGPATSDINVARLVVPRERPPYEPYLAEPARYQWIVDLWKE